MSFLEWSGQLSKSNSFLSIFGKRTHKIPRTHMYTHPLHGWPWESSQTVSSENGIHLLFTLNCTYSSNARVGNSIFSWRIYGVKPAISKGNHKEIPEVLLAIDNKSTLAICNFFFTTFAVTYSILPICLLIFPQKN